MTGEDRVSGDRVVVFDTTLRDGEQAPGFSMGEAEKLEMARVIAALGVDVMEAGFAAASPGDEECIRRIAGLYGGRPGTLGMLRLLKAVLGHLAVTGSIAVGDTLLQQLVGHGLAGRLSTKLGEGVVNGLMTARIGLSAMDVCRPLPFLREDRPRLKDLTGHLVTPGRDAMREG